LSRDTNDAKKLASLLETIPYEVLCGISTRVERRYKSAANVR
jgi:alanine racemase